MCTECYAQKMENSFRMLNPLRVSVRQKWNTVVKHPVISGKGFPTVATWVTNTRLSSKTKILEMANHTRMNHYRSSISCTKFHLSFTHGSACSTRSLFRRQSSIELLSLTIFILWKWCLMMTWHREVFRPLILVWFSFVRTAAFW